MEQQQVQQQVQLGVASTLPPASSCQPGRPTRRLRRRHWQHPLANWCRCVRVHRGGTCLCVLWAGRLCGWQCGALTCGVVCCVAARTVRMGAEPAGGRQGMWGALPLGSWLSLVCRNRCPFHLPPLRCCLTHTLRTHAPAPHAGCWSCAGAAWCAVCDQGCQ